MTEETTPAGPEQFWWPDPQCLKDLTVMKIEEGLLFSAGDGTLCSDWLDYWYETTEREAIFSEEIQKALLDHANKILEPYGESIHQQQHHDQVDSQEVCAGKKQAN